MYACSDVCMYTCMYVCWPNRSTAASKEISAYKLRKLTSAFVDLLAGPATPQSRIHTSDQRCESQQLGHLEPLRMHTAYVWNLSKLFFVHLSHQNSLQLAKDLPCKRLPTTVAAWWAAQHAHPLSSGWLQNVTIMSAHMLHVLLGIGGVTRQRWRTYHYNRRSNPACNPFRLFWDGLSNNTRLTLISPAPYFSTMKWPAIAHTEATKNLREYAKCNWRFFSWLSAVQEFATNCLNISFLEPSTLASRSWGSINRIILGENVEDLQLRNAQTSLQRIFCRKTSALCKVAVARRAHGPARDT